MPNGRASDKRGVVCSVSTMVASRDGKKVIEFGALAHL